MGIPSPQLQNLKAEFFRALAHPIRIRLLEVLVARGTTSVQDLQRALGIDQPIVSQQLARLRASGIVAAKRDGRQILNRRLVSVRTLLRELDQDSVGRA